MFILGSSISVPERVRISDDLSVAMRSSLARAASARASMRLGSSISAVGRSCLVLHLIGFLPASFSLGLIRSNLGLQPHFGSFFLSSSLALVTPASLDAACLRFMFYVEVFVSVLPATVRSLRPSLGSCFCL